jgi:thioredoxin 1
MSMRLLVVMLSAIAVVLIGAGLMRWLTPAPAPVPVAPPAAASAHPIAELIDANDLAKLIAAHGGPVLLDFHADYCEPCKQLHPRLERLSGERPDLLVVGVDVARAEAVSQQYGVAELPLMVLLQDGKERDRQVGLPSQDQLRAWVAAKLAAPAGGAATAAAASPVTAPVPAPATGAARAATAASP